VGQYCTSAIIMKLGSMDPALICSGPMSTFSYDSHPMSRGRMVDELPRLQQDKKTDSYTAQQMDLEIQRVARELYKAFSGLNEEFKEVRDDVCAGELPDVVAEGPDSDR